MRMLRLVLSAWMIAAVPAAAAFVSTDAEASVSIAVTFDGLVKDADAVAVLTPLESKSVWEDGRICTYTKLRVDQTVAGEPGGETWVRTLGGVVGKIGQLVDGEPVFVNGKSSLLFLRKFKSGTTFEVSARAQGQYPILVDDLKKAKKVVRSANVGVLFPPKAVSKEYDPNDMTRVQPRGVATGATSQAQTMRMAQEVMHDKPLDEITREIATTWKRLHSAK